MMIYDALKNKLLGCICPLENTASYKVDWNQLDQNFIVMGSQSGNTYVVDCSDYKNLKVTSTVNHNCGGIFGV